MDLFKWRSSLAIEISGLLLVHVVTSQGGIPFPLFFLLWGFSSSLSFTDMSGQAASYYNEGVPQGQPQPYAYDRNSYQPNVQAPYPQPNYQQPAYQQPTYQQPAYQQPGPEPKQQYQQNVPESGYTFDQAFKVEKPKWNDLWAGLLVSELALKIPFTTDWLHS
jgi:hypothetical protein